MIRALKSLRDGVAKPVEPLGQQVDRAKQVDRGIGIADLPQRRAGDGICRNGYLLLGNRLWRALTYDSGPYDVTTPTLALCHLARVFFAAGVAAALAGCVDMVQPPDIAVAEELCAKRGGYSHAQRWERGTVLDITCKDGTQLQVRVPKKG